MNIKTKYLLKNIGILTISNFASKIITFFLVPLYTSVLSTSEYGTYDLIVSTIALLYPILTINIADAVMRFCMEKIWCKNDIVVIGLKYMCSSIGLICLVLLGISIFDAFQGLMIFILVYYIFNSLNQFFIQFAKGLERVKDMGIAGILGTLILIFTNIYFLLVLDLGLKGFFLSNIITQVIIASYYFLRLKLWEYLLPLKINRDLEKQMIFYSIPLICTVLGWWINSSFDKYIVTMFCGLAANGLLSISYKIPSLINSLQGIFIQAWQITAIKEYGKLDTAMFYGKMFTYINNLMSLACSLLILLTKPLAYMLYSNDFFEAWRYVPFLLVSCVMNCASGFIGPILSAKKDTKNMALSAIYGTVTNVILNLILVYFIGIQGATISTMISSYIIFYCRKRAVNHGLIIEKKWKVLITWLLLILQSMTAIYLSIFYIQLFIIGLTIILNRDVFSKSYRFLNSRIMRRSGDITRD
jgi:O-antigen/teichoic acid export membrane protein